MNWAPATTATVLQLKDGETQMLAGLISDEDRRTANKIPGLGDIPVFGRLFSTQGDDIAQDRDRDADHAAHRAHARLGPGRARRLAGGYRRGDRRAAAAHFADRAGSLALAPGGAGMQRPAAVSNVPLPVPMPEEVQAGAPVPVPSNEGQVPGQLPRVSRVRREQQGRATGPLRPHLVWERCCSQPPSRLVGARRC